MSPIFVRPVREQAEHDRLVRFLLAKFKRKFDETQANIGDEQLMPIKVGPASLFPDLLLIAQRKMTGVIEVESAESVNNLEAMAQWVPFGRSKVSFFLYVPVTAYEAAKRLCDAHGVTVAEIWTYRPTSDGFDLIRTFHDSSAMGGTIAVKALPPPRPEKIEKPDTPEPEPEKPVKLEKSGKFAKGSAKAEKPLATPASPAKPAKIDKLPKSDKTSKPEKPGAPVKPNPSNQTGKPGNGAKPPIVAKPTVGKPANGKPANGKSDKPAPAKPQSAPARPQPAPVKPQPAAKSKPAPPPPPSKKMAAKSKPVPASPKKKKKR